MDDPLRDNRLNIRPKRRCRVLILIVMDDPLRVSRKDNENVIFVES